MKTQQNYPIFPCFSLHAVYKLCLLSLCFLVITSCTQKSADDHFEQAMAFIQSGNPNSAIVELKNAIVKSPREAKIRFELGKLYAETRQYEDATKELTRALDFGYDRASVIPLLAKSLEYTGANVALSQLDIEGDYLSGEQKLELGYRKARAFIELEQLDQASLLISNLSAIDSNSVYSGLLSATSDLLRNRLDEASNKSDELIEREPLNRDILYFAANTYLNNNQPIKAINTLENYLLTAPDDLQTKFRVANVMIRNGKAEEAERYIDELLAINDQHALLNQLKGAARASAGDFEKAFEYGEKSIFTGRKDPALFLLTGSAAYSLGLYDKAIDYLSTIADELPDNHPGLRALSASLIAMRKGDIAKPFLDRINNQEEFDSSLLVAAGLSALSASDEKTARALASRATALVEKPEDLLRLGVLKLSLDDVDGFVDLEEAVKQAPDSTVAKQIIASAYLAKGRFEDALMIARSMQLETENALMGWLLEFDILFASQDYGGAQAALDEAKSLNANTLDIQIAELKLLVVKGLDQQSIKLSNEILQQDPANVLVLGALYEAQTREGNSTNAYSKIMDAVKAEPSNQQLALLGVVTAFLEDKTADALSILDNLSYDRETTTDLWALRGTSFIQTRQFEKGEAFFKSWLQTYPKNERALNGLVQIYDLTNNFEDGLEAAEQFLENEENTQVRVTKLYFLAKLNRAQEARLALNLVPDELMETPFIRAIKARIALTEGRPHDALDDAQFAYENLNLFDNLRLYTNALAKTEQTDSALQTIEQHVQKYPNDMSAKMLAAQYTYRNSPAEAITIYESIIESAPNNAVVLNNLAYLYKQKGEYEKAERYIGQALAIEPNNISFNDTYAQVLLLTGKIKSAFDIYEQILNETVENESIHLNYVEALAKFGNIGKAKQHIRRHDFKSTASLARLKELSVKYEL